MSPQFQKPCAPSTYVKNARQIRGVVSARGAQSADRDVEEAAPCRVGTAHGPAANQRMCDSARRTRSALFLGILTLPVQYRARPRRNRHATCSSQAVLVVFR